MHVEAAAPERREEASPSAAGRGGAPDARWLPLLAAAAAGVPALLYALLRPPSFDLPAHLLRAHLFSVEGFGLWNNLWYGGHPTPGYSLLFSPVAAALGPQTAAALACVLTAPLLAGLAAPIGSRGRLGVLWLAAATTVNLFSGRLTFAFGLLPAAGAVLALSRRRPGVAAAAAGLSGLCSPVAAVFCALACGAMAAERGARSRPGAWRASAVGVAAAALVPVLALGVAFPERGTEPFAFSVLWPVLILGAGGTLFLPRGWRAVRTGCALFGLLCLGSYLIPSALGSNAARLGPLVAGPVAALAWWPRRRVALALLALPLLYLQWQAPARDLIETAGQPSEQAAYYQPLLGFLRRQRGGPFRVEIPFTAGHAEAFYVASRFPLARGWERQVDRAQNRLFYAGTLTPASYRAWLARLAVRFVALPDAPTDPAGAAEAALIRQRLPYLRLTFRSRHWQVFTVRKPTALVQGAAAGHLGGDYVSFTVRHPGAVLVRVRFSPYWRLDGVPGCVTDRGGLTELRLGGTGRARLVIAFSVSRIGAGRPRCTP